MCEPSKACDGRLIVSGQRQVNAWADGHNVRVTQKMMQFARCDDELAFVVAHELAHNLLGHAARLRSATALSGAHGDEVAGQSQGMEVEADALAVTLVANAGFDIDAAAPFIARSMHGRHPGSRTHPGAATRIAALRVAALQHAEALL